MRLVVGVTGASGVIYAKRLLEVLNDTGVEVDLIVTEQADYLIHYELGLSIADFAALATTRWDMADFAADIASGSQSREGMIIIPCTMNTVAKMAHGIADNLLLRCSDVMLKENRKLIIVPRETPLHETHLENLLRLRRMGVTIIPPITAFYHHPTSILEVVDYIIAKILDQFAIPHQLIERWQKPEGDSADAESR